MHHHFQVRGGVVLPDNTRSPPTSSAAAPRHSRGDATSCLIVDNNIYSDNMKNLALLGFAIAMQQTKNGLYFDHFKLDDLKITANGLSVMEFELNFPNKYTSLYTRIIDSMNSDRHLISHSKFGSGMTIITADCKDSENNSFMQIEKHGHLEIHMWFSESLPKAIFLIIM